MLENSKVAREDLAWAAGFFDGEGSVSIKRLPWPTTRPSLRASSIYGLRIILGNRNSEPVFWLKDHFGGSVHVRHFSNPKHAPAFVWVAASRVAASFLSQILPYLKVKSEIARLGLELQESMGKLPHVRKNGYRAGFEPLPPEVLLHREALWGKAKELNKRGPRSDQVLCR